MLISLFSCITFPQIFIASSAGRTTKQAYRLADGHKKTRKRFSRVSLKIVAPLGRFIRRRSVGAGSARIAGVAGICSCAGVGGSAWVARISCSARVAGIAGVCSCTWVRAARIAGVRTGIAWIACCDRRAAEADASLSAANAARARAQHHHAAESEAEIGGGKKTMLLLFHKNLSFH